MTTRLTFTIPGPPVPASRPRVFFHKNAKRPVAMTPERYAAYKHLVEIHTRVAMAGARWSTPPDGVTFGVTLRVYRKVRRGDADNFLKGCLDGFTRAGVWRDDRFVEKTIVDMLVDPVQPRVEVEIEILSTRRRV